ncbi:MAG: hypothetical protein OEY09_09000 [Gammaproteobacteria bacterium]|nr:hypothetical protein [Gammaproteobacteria bacterium]
MPIRLLLIFSFIYYCVKIRTNPARYFQINAQYFNKTKGIFSKLDIDRLIPPRWLLRQCLDTGQTLDFTYPVFVKPEWGQNGYGIRRADSPAELEEIRRLCVCKKMPCIIQEAATETREFEIFFVLCAEDESKPAVLSVTEAHNSGQQKLPINSINNSNTIYREITESFNAAELETIWQHVSSFGRFGISRVGVRANSVADLVKGDFHVIEINLFVPLPINLLDPNKTHKQRISIALNTTRNLAQIVKSIPDSHPVQSVFLKKWLVARKVKMLAVTR